MSSLSVRQIAAFGGFLLIAAVPALVHSGYGFLDRGPSRTYAGIVTAKRALKGGSYLTLKGAPELPAPDNTIEVRVSVRDYYNAPMGDSVFLVMKPGFFHHPWIVSYRVQTAQDRVDELLERHRALERHGDHQVQHP